MRSSQALVCVCLAVVLMAPEARTQEQAQDESPVERARVGLRASTQLRERQHERAKEGRWAWTFLGMLAAGYDSNIYETPSTGPTPLGSPGEEGSFGYDLGVKAAALRYFNDRDRLSLSLSAAGSPNLEDSDITEYRQQLRARYTARMSRRVRFSVSGSLKHDNDSEVDAFGGPLTRDYENFAYRASPSLRYRLGRGHSLRLSFPLKRKDYKETNLENSLDWWEAGSALTYRGRGRRASIELGYEFVVRNYDEELASLSDGTLLATNPEEEHRYRKFALELGWRASDNLELFGGYRFKTKDDRFEGFELYDDRRWGAGGLPRLLDASGHSGQASPMGRGTTTSVWATCPPKSSSTTRSGPASSPDTWCPATSPCSPAMDSWSEIQTAARGPRTATTRSTGSSRGVSYGY